MEDIHFGTDGWRAIIGESFTDDERRARRRRGRARVQGRGCVCRAPRSTRPDTLIVGHDCRQDAHAYAQLAAQVAAAHGFDVKLTQDYCPTPALCWSVAHDEDAIAGIMLTSSHNPAEYLGVKLRMADGGASPKEFTDRVEAQLAADPWDGRGTFQEVDLMSAYLDALKDLVDAEAIRAAHLRVVVDPLYGAGRGYLSGLLRDMGVEVCEINDAADPTFDGLHPEPIPPWVDRGLAKVSELGYDAVFINDGDADRIGAGDEHGNFVNPHRIITLLVQHMVEDRARIGSRGQHHHGVGPARPHVPPPGSGTGVHARGLQMDLRRNGKGRRHDRRRRVGRHRPAGSCEGARRAADGAAVWPRPWRNAVCSLGQLVDDMFAKIGRLEFARRGLTVTEGQMERFRRETVPAYEAESICGKRVVGVDRRDGVKFLLEGDAWVMMRPSGTEPLVRVYAEAATTEEVDALLDAAARVVKGE